MAHELSRLIAAYGAQPWLIDGVRANQMIEAIAFRAEHGIAASAARKADGGEVVAKSDEIAAPNEGVRAIGVINLMGALMPRLSGVDAMSGDFASLTQFQREFTQMAARADLRAIVLNVDSPGGQVDLVQETAEQIRSARRSDRPIVAIANTTAASAAYWIAAAADELVVSPSGIVGSIGVYTIHQDISERMAKEGVRMTLIKAGPRKAEGHPFAPLDDQARADIQRRVRSAYADFTSSVADYRGVTTDVVRADPEEDEAHFGGGRAYEAKLAVELGMADRVETFSDLIARLQAPKPKTATSRRRALAAL